MHIRSLLSFVALMAAPLAAQERPNILLIVVDDQSPFDLGIYEPSSTCRTPVIDALAARGTVVDGAYHMGSWSGAVCTPSRHMIMSGRTVWHLPKRGVRGEKENPHCPPDLAEQTLAAVFNRAGYDTMRTCKRGNSYPAANAQFKVVHDKTCRKADAENGSPWHAERVLEYLGERDDRGDQDPFLIYLGFSHPHDPRWAPDELLQRYGADNQGPQGAVDDRAPALPKNYLPAHPFHHGHPGLRDEVKVQGVMRRRDEATIRNERGRQFACNENIDTQIGRVLAKLEATGELDDTIIVYTADHGMAIGRHGLQGKQNLYEHTWRVPMVVAGPGVPAGQRVQGNVYLLDLLPTLCDYAGVAAPATVEGVSMRPVLSGERAKTRDVLFGVYAGGTKPGMRCVRKGDWKLIQYDVLSGRVRKTQLFHLGDNPDELLEQHAVDVVQALTGNKPDRAQVDLADDPRFAAQRAELEALLLAEMERLDDPYRMWCQPKKSR
ncbi:MAG: sulfatase-like hydrolase/transferase [Planctomycetota bacterium]|nr:sulfatase-like hydrolase/transferase [Planctomycetota bacterium]